MVVPWLHILENLAALVLSWALSTLVFGFIFHVLLSVEVFLKKTKERNSTRQHHKKRLFVF